MLTANQLQIEGGWNELKGKVKQAWGQLNDDTLREFEGDAQEFIGLIQRQTGEGREQVAAQLQELDERFRPVLTQAYDAARQYVDQTTEHAQEAAEQLRAQLAAGHADAQRLVRRRPVESVAVAFGAGLIAGVVVGLVARSR